MSVSISGEGSVTGIDQGLNVVGVVTATTISVGSGTSVSSPATNVLTLGTNNSERVRINSSGAVGLGTANPQERLHNSITTNNQNYLRLDNPSGTSYYGLNSSGDTEINAATNNNIIFKTFGTERSRITSTGNVQIANGNLVFSTAGTGIDFSATANSSGTMSSEVFSDYEEGTWTATMTCASTGSVTLLNNSGTYTRIGNICYVGAWIRVNGATTGSASGGITISGFPFNATGQDNYRGRIWLSGYAFTGVTGTWGWIIVGDGSNSFPAYYGVSAWNTVTAFDGTNIRSTNAEFYINGFYKVA